jgi:hypothetical protein
MDTRMPTSLRYPERKTSYCTHFDFSRLVQALPCPHRCFIHCTWVSFSHNQGKEISIIWSTFPAESYLMSKGITLQPSMRASAMVYALQNFCHYLLGSTFKFFTDHSALKYLVNKPMLGGRIYQWLFLFQEFDFKVVVKPGKHNVGSDHLSRIETGEASQSLNDELSRCATLLSGSHTRSIGQIT